MRLIDADELLRKLEEYFNKKEQDAKFTGNRGSEVSWNDAIYYIKTAPSAQPEQRWIPCSERLPEKHGEMYLVTISDGSVYSFALQWDINRKRWYLSFLNNGESLIEYIDDVIAWMPLPEPYQEEGERNG